MGQPNVRDKKRPSTLQRPAAVSGPGVRPSAVNDAVLHSTANPPVRPVHHDPAQSSKYPIVIRYLDQDVKKLIEKKKNIFLCVEALGWKPHPMTASTDSFYALLELPPGNHNFRFLVDNTEVVDSTQPLAPSPNQRQVEVPNPTGVEPSIPLPPPTPATDGKPANTVFLNHVLLTTKEDDDIMDDGKGWGQEEVKFDESRKYPPLVPLHLRYTPLNTPPTLVRCAPDGRLAVMEDDQDFTRHMAAEHLPLPLSVTINHVYFQRREDHAVMGVTTRYCNKFTTVVYYTHLPPTGQSP